jgi:cystathionine beta-lyase/cystathionine gamma-synthase
MARREAGMTTRAVHVGHEPETTTGAVGTPIFQVSTFLHPRRRDAEGEWVENPDWIYTRWANPTTKALERKMASLEGAQASMAFSSGMAAISSSVLAHVGSGGRMVAMADIYGGTYSLFSRNLAHLGVEVAWVRGASAEDLVQAADETTSLVYLEAPTNPFNRVVDIPAVVKGLRKRFGEAAPKVVIDATFASPYNLRPLEHGVDVVVHSATKYLNGHSDLIAGIASGSAERVGALVPWMRNLGASMDPNQAFLVARGMRTFPLRMQRHNENAERLAGFLADHRKVERVWYPSLADHPDHVVAKRLMRGFGGVVSFSLASDAKDAGRRFIESLEYFHAAASLGGVESLATLPRETSHSYLDDGELAAAGLTPSFVRLAVGIEDADDLEADLERALSVA